MRWVWVVWLLLIIASFAVLEGFALQTDRITLSEFVWQLSQEWPPLPWVIGVINGGLAVHFWWIWNPKRKDEENAQ